MGDNSDVFPNDPTESVDSDGDGVGDNADICPDGDDTIDSDGDGTPDDCDTECPGDINGDFVVDVADFSEFLVQFGLTGEGLSGDFDDDQDVDVADFSIFLVNFGNDCIAPLRAAPVKTKRKQKQTH